MSKLPEETTPAELYYNEEQAQTYTRLARINEVQRELAARCLELLEIDKFDEKLILNLGCGSAICGEILTEVGANWIGMDIAPAMLDVAKENETQALDLILGDIGQVHKFRPGSFDAAVSVSVLHWLCYAFTAIHEPRSRLKTFFRWLFVSLKRDGRAALQFYPRNDEQMEIIAKSAVEAGFLTAFVVDNEESSKNRKIYLLLSTGTAPGGSITTTHFNAIKRKLKPSYKDKIVKKKESQRNKGMTVRPDSKYTDKTKALPKNILLVRRDLFAHGEWKFDFLSSFQVEIVKKRAFKLYSYRGVPLDKLMDMEFDQMVELLPSKARRKFMRGVNKYRMKNFLAKLMRAKKETVVGTKPRVVRTHYRNMIVVPEMIGSIIGIYNGKVYMDIEIKAEMIGRFLGEFALTYKPVKHGKYGATTLRIPGSKIFQINY